MSENCYSLPTHAQLLRVKSKLQNRNSDLEKARWKTQTISNSGRQPPQCKIDNTHGETSITHWVPPLCKETSLLSERTNWRKDDLIQYGALTDMQGSTTWVFYWKRLL